MSNKIQKYYKLKREQDYLEEKIQEVKSKQRKIFLSKFNLGVKSYNASSILNVFLSHPEETFDRYLAIRYVDFCWSRASLDQHIDKIFKVFHNEGTIIKLKRGWYKLNPEFVETVGRNKK